MLGVTYAGRFATPIKACTVSPFAGRFEARRKVGLTPSVGRKSELAMLTSRWHSAAGGSGQVVLIGGEPGVGKSRLAQEFADQIQEPHLRTATNSYVIEIAI
ncbi:AAA family ATPase [Bradyrhizobium sp. CCBAU 21362]|uniref:AAA family ATPase n=1 Tax=Bradyrhizobium sp. CCBAU 21362 TaxID=1325082 RepID=UPI002305DCC8|nr:ATP-binding protein [Bradyrhizobium sp. CCBAU 21362]